MRCLVLALCLGAVLAPAGGAVLPNIIERKVLDNSVLPVNASARPPLWDYRLLSSAQSIAITPKPQSRDPRKNQTWTLTVKHAPLPGVTPDMVEWMYTNLHNRTAKHPANNQSYLLYHLLHPSDHGSMGGSMINRAMVTFYEFPLTECTQPGANPEDPWVCATGSDTNPGYTQVTPESAWEWKDQVNSTSRVTRKKGQLDIIYRGCNSRGQCANVVFTTHKWAVNKTTQQLEWTTNFKVSHYATGNWKNGYSPLMRLYRQATHYVQETGSLLGWLPMAYASR